MNLGRAIILAFAAAAAAFPAAAPSTMRERGVPLCVGT